MQHYDHNNIFARILRKEIPCEPFYEDDLVLVFRDIHPHRKVHLLLIPKGAYRDVSVFGQDAKDDELIALMRAVPRVAEKAGIAQSGYRLIVNCGADAGQEVPHLHIHMLGGEKVGPLVASQ